MVCVIFAIIYCITVFRKAREDEAASSKRLNEMIANYGDVIPRRDFETLSKTFQVCTHFEWNDRIVT